MAREPGDKSYIFEDETPITDEVPSETPSGKTGRRLINMATPLEGEQGGKTPFILIGVVACVVLLVVAIMFFNIGSTLDYWRVEPFLLDQCAKGVNDACLLLK